MDAYRHAIRAVVASIPPVDALEREHRDAALDWIDGGAELCRRTPPDVPSPHLVAYFAVVDREREAILLVEHRKAGLWLPPGGHVEPHEDPAGTVQREASEELGLTVHDVSPPRFLTVQQTAGANPHVDVSLWYVLPGEAGATFAFDGREFRSVRWFAFDALPREGAEPHLARFVAKLRASRSYPPAG